MKSRILSATKNYPDAIKTSRLGGEPYNEIGQVISDVVYFVTDIIPDVHSVESSVHGRGLNIAAPKLVIREVRHETSLFQEVRVSPRVRILD